MYRIFFILIIMFFTLDGKSQQGSGSAEKINHKKFDNLYKINDSLYRSEQPDKGEFAELEKLGIRSVLNLRNYHYDKPGKEDLQVRFFHIKMNAHHITDDDVIKAIQVLQSAPKPLVIHCKHGADRTGVIVAMYRIIFQNWSREQALEELVNGGYGFHPIFKNIPRYIQEVDIENIKKRINNEAG